MAHYITIIIFLVTFNLRCSISFNQEIAKSSIKNFEAIDSEEVVSDVADNIIVSKPTNKCLPSSQEQDEKTKCLEDLNYTHGTISQNDESSLSISEHKHETPYTIDEQESFLEGDGSTLQYIQPTISVPPTWARATYQVDNPSASLASLGIGMSSYGSILYPHVHPKLLASLNSGFSLSSLPPVQSTYIHGLYSPQEAVQKINYDLDVLSSQNTVLMPTLVRPGRMLRSSEDDFLAQLSHDAIMNNILPTMPVPFARYAAPPAYSSGDVAGGSAIAVFPNAASSGCSLPILFSCSPKITRGTVRQQLPVENYQAPYPVAHVAYRQQPEQKNMKPNQIVKSSPLPKKHTMPILKERKN